MAGDTDIQLLRVIRDLQASIEELRKDQERNELPITDDNPVLHGLCTRLEYLLQYDQKEKKAMFGSRKDYWDYISLCLNNHKCGTNAVQFINHTTQLNTSLGKGRAFIRYCLVRQKLADSLQLCFLNQQLVGDWYYARSPFLSDRLRSDIVDMLYSLNEINFDLDLEGVDLDTAWPLGKREYKIPRRTTTTRIPFKSLFKAKNIFKVGLYKKPNYWLGKEPEHEKPVAIGRMQSSMKSEAPRIPSGASATHSASKGLSDLLGNQEPNLDVYGNGSRSNPCQQLQSQHDEQVHQHEEQSIGLVSNLKQKPNGSEVPRGSSRVAVQRSQELVSTLTTDEKRETELEVISEQRSLLEKLSIDLTEKEDVIEQLNFLLKEREKTHEEESSKLQQEISNLKELLKNIEEQSNKLEQLEDSNNFLNETVEEMDKILDELKQAMVEKDHENMLLRKEQVEKIVAAQQIHEPELEKLKCTLGEHQKEDDGLKEDTDERLKTAKEELRNKKPILVQFQSKTNLENWHQLDEMKELQIKLQNMASENNSLEEKYKASQQEVKGLKMSLISLQSEISKLQTPEKQLLQQSGAVFLSPNGGQLKLAIDNGNPEENLREGQNELVNQELQRNESTQEETASLENVIALKLEHHQAMVKKENTNIATREREDLNVLKDKLEEINQKLEASNAEKLETKQKLEETVDQLHMLMAKQSSTENQTTESKDRHVAHEAEMKVELATSARNHTETVVVQPESAELKQRLHEVCKERTTAQRELSAALSALEQSDQEVTRVKKQMEELENGRRLQVQEMLGRIKTIEAEREALVQQKDDLRKTVSILEENLLYLRDNTAKVELTSDKSQGGMERAQDKVKHLQAQLVELSSEKVELEGEIVRLTKQQEDDAVCQLESTRDSKEQLASLAKEKKELCAELQTVREQVSSLQQLLEQARSEFELEMAKKMAECNRQTEALNEDLLTTRKDVQHKLEELKSKDDELLSLAESLTQMRRAEEDLKDTLKKTQEDAKRREEESQCEIRVLRETVRSLKERTVELLREKDILWQKSDNLEFNQRQLDQKRLSRKDRFGSKK
ncbi:FYVE and coiled-coil domain-containing protein 1-like [Stegostoma tigrinum]|uniref:FYVE and coiled-coil domain-containing protein 1-like n=1 Tax=Stegostoma tigrinum TaxID=3053191 RepID=UPI00287019E5|nr:FYVE and coiled-coil domain-containing protein 1-like [Stegostoma tigrinum]